MANKISLEKMAVKIAKSVISEKFNNGKHLSFVPEGGCFCYDSTHWKPYTVDNIKKQIFDQVLDEYPDYEHKAEQLATKGLKFAELHYLSKEGLPMPNENVLNLKNGELWISPTGQVTLEKHSPSSGQLWCLDVDYNADAKAPVFESTLEGIFSLCDDIHGVRRHLMELFGYIISSSRHLPVIAMFIGPGSNGKTKLSQTLIKLLGADSVLCQPMKSMIADNFFNIGLLGKALYLDDDLATNTTLPDGKLKALSEGKLITARPPHGKSITFTSKAIPLLLANHMPKTADISYGMKRRVHILKFATVFSGKNKDDSLFPEIWDSEMSGILNLCLEGYQRLMERGDFMLPDEMVINVDAWFAEANAIPAFIEDACCIDPSCSIKGTDLYKSFLYWAKQSGYKSLPNRNEFYSQIEKLGHKKVKPQNAVTFHGLCTKELVEDT